MLPVGHCWSLLAHRCVRSVSAGATAYARSGSPWNVEPAGPHQAPNLNSSSSVRSEPSSAIAVTRTRAATWSPVAVVIRFPLSNGTGAYVKGSVLDCVNGSSSRVELSVCSGSVDQRPRGLSGVAPFCGWSRQVRRGRRLVRHTISSQPTCGASTTTDVARRCNFKLT